MAQDRYGIAWLALVMWGCTHGGAHCGETDGRDDPCPGASEPELPAQCEQQEAVFHALFLNPEPGYALPATMVIARAEPGLLTLMDGDVSHRIELGSISFDEWFSPGETVSLEYLVDAPYRGLEVRSETTTLLQLAQSSAPLPNGVQLLGSGDGCTFERDWPRSDPRTITIAGLNVVDPSMGAQLTEPGEVFWIDGWLMAGVTRTRSASSDGTQPQNEAWAAVALGPRSEEE